MSQNHQAVSEGYYDNFKILLDNNSDPIVLDYRGRLPIDLAKIQGHNIADWDWELLILMDQSNKTKMYINVIMMKP
jgi:hypothetical protein